MGDDDTPGFLEDRIELPDPCALQFMCDVVSQAVCAVLVSPRLPDRQKTYLYPANVTCALLISMHNARLYLFPS